MYLVYRVSGSHEKVEFFEFYASRPAFDSCGSTSMPPVTQVEFVRSRGRLRQVRWQGTHLELIFTDRPVDAVLPEDAKLSKWQRG
jgi:hypothetical protein